jgi:hypothetical protein
MHVLGGTFGFVRESMVLGEDVGKKRRPEYGTAGMKGRKEWDYKFR